MAAMDGLYSACSGNPEVPGWLGRMFVCWHQAAAASRCGREKLRSSAAALVIAPETEDKSAWVRTGRSMSGWRCRPPPWESNPPS
ncbi:MAG: hypothetical protein MZV63_07165 [Marinilabiliales bacterium]|nr:hypothetical protein [Marinilabiliales bacterium]